MSETLVSSKMRSENNNTYHWKPDTKRAAPCTCARYTQSNACALKHRFGVRIHSGIRRSPELALAETDPEVSYMTLESRDNPFVPGSDLCKEAEEILQKATIIRDRFILRDEAVDTPDGEVTSETQSQPNSPGNGKDCSVVEEALSPQTSAPVNTAPKARQNGKIDDSVSPTTVKVEVGGGQSDGLTVVGDSKDKKKQKKCCNIM
ncbi:uncharacterized protein LOC132557376 isoform X4 [Ylistrum balloti]|uniref:uncharacterized protein LOC132557376 isoform X4 n=1 Tax=Ylistrum balloti TaxID=509963 RepID=UPI00290581DD|nr:uncharacterized protein LOC132557376 isoform X4 [Ylistrum balloti]